MTAMVSVIAADVPEQKTIKFDTMGRLALPSGAAAIFQWSLRRETSKNQS